MSQETTEQKADRQARLSRAMAAMLLQDKVEKLERDVDRMSYSRGIRSAQSSQPLPKVRNESPNHSNRQPFPGGQVRILARSTTGPGFIANLDRNLEPASSQTDNLVVRVRLIDASVLIFSLRTVYKWQEENTSRIIIPLEAINTLDLLKKGQHPINVAARKATRFLEERMSLDRSDSHASGDCTSKVAGLFSQRDTERASVSQLEQLRQSIFSTCRSECATVEAESAENKDGVEPEHQVQDMYLPRLAPLYLREYLGAAVYLHQNKVHAAQKQHRDLDLKVRFTAVVTHPPSGLESELAYDDQDGNAVPTNPFWNRIDGRTTEHWLRAYQLPVEAISTAKPWLADKLSSRTVSKGKCHNSKSERPSRCEADVSTTSTSYGTISILQARPATGVMEDGDEGPITVRPWSSSASSTHSVNSPLVSSIHSETTSGRLQRPLPTSKSAADRMEEYIKNLS